MRKLRWVLAGVLAGGLARPYDFESTETRGGGELSGPEESIIHQIRVPLSNLAPGRYLLEVRARSRAEPEETTEQTAINVV